MSSISGGQQSGAFALVTYVTDPLGSFLTRLRQSLPGAETPQPHLTILPPRPLMLPAKDAWVQAKKTLEDFTAFEVELGRVKIFPETNILYLDIIHGSQHLQHLHDALNTGSLRHEERFDYSPHVTLSDPLRDTDIEAGCRQAETLWNNSGLPHRFDIADVVFLWQPDGTDEKWQRLWSYRLQDPSHKAAEAATPNQ